MAAHSTPVGSIGWDVPACTEGCCLEPDGRELLRADYPELFSLILNVYGGDAERGTFRLPDLRSKMVMEPSGDRVWILPPWRIRALP